MMKTLVELFDLENTIDNILASHIFKPERVVFLTDERPECISRIWEIERALTRKYPGMKFTIQPLNTSRNVNEVCERLLATYPDPVFDLTGGNDAISFAISQLCNRRFRPCFCIDWREGVILCSEAAEDYKAIFQMPTLMLEDLLEANGAMIFRKMHATPPENRFDAILEFFQETLKHPKEWLMFCRFLQQAAAEANRKKRPTVIQCKQTISDPNGRGYYFRPEFAQLALRLGFLKDLEITPRKVHMKFADEMSLRYLTSQGTWLELYSFIMAKRSGWFHDCQMSVVIDWDGIPQRKDNVVNEIDVMLMRGITPIFISCKTSVPTTESLNEIELYAKKLGGAGAKSMLVTTAALNDAPTVRIRAKELDLILVERNDLLKGNGLLPFLKRAGNVP